MIDTSVWPTKPFYYLLGNVIGVGSVSVVYSATCISLNTKCSIKRINISKLNVPSDLFTSKVQEMAMLNHENIIHYYTSFMAYNELWLVFELLEGGSLQDIINYKMAVQNCKHGVLDEVTIATVLKEVLKGLKHLHSTGLMHRDIKASNILMAEDGAVKITDCGMASWFSSSKNEHKKSYDFIGSPYWMAPEINSMESEFDSKADIWSFGITAIELSTGFTPYHKFTPMKSVMMTLQRDPPNLDTGAKENKQYKSFGKTFRKMIQSCLQKDPAKRPDTDELLNNKFFYKSKDKKYLYQTLLATGPSFEMRVNKIKTRHPMVLGKLHRTVPAHWKWIESEKKMLCASNNPKFLELEILKQDSLPSIKKVKLNPYYYYKCLGINFLKQLKDIHFDFVFGSDTAEGVAKELLAAGFLDPRDIVPLAEHLEKILIENLTEETNFQVVTFGLNSVGANEEYDEKSLVGFAQLSFDTLN